MRDFLNLFVAGVISILAFEGIAYFIDNANKKNPSPKDCQVFYVASEDMN